MLIGIIEKALPLLQARRTSILICVPLWLQLTSTSFLVPEALGTTASDDSNFFWFLKPSPSPLQNMGQLVSDATATAQWLSLCLTAHVLAC